jgi:two-component system OmpR family sensor kinase
VSGRSLERRLSRAILGTVLAVGLMAAAGSFLVGYLEASGLQDATLRQVAAMSSKIGGVHSESDNLSVYLPDEPRPAWLPEGLSPGFHTIESGGESIRIFVRELPGGKRIVTAQPIELRQDVATSSALHTFVPVLFLLPLLAWLTARVLAGERRILERQRRFIAEAAHELRSPLTALSLQAENVCNAASLEAARERAAAVRAGIDRTRRLTDQLLRLSRPITARTQVAFVDLPSLARESISDWIPKAEAKGVDLGMEVEGNARLSADIDDLRLILHNALDNAIRCTPRGNRVTVRIRDEGADALLEVEDSGPGIPAEHRAAVFEPFHRLGSSGDGSGLGLSIARDAARRAGGTIGLFDRTGGSGLLFRYRQRRG